MSNVEEGGKAVGLKRAGWGWHSDGEDKAVPNDGSFLHALEDGYGGRVCLIAVDPLTGRASGASDPRGDGGLAEVP